MRRANAAGTGPLGAWCGSSLAPFLRGAGLTDVMRRGWLVERWPPPPPATREFVAMGLRYQAGLAQGHDGVPAADREALRAAAAGPGRLLDDPDFCLRESFVVTSGRVPARPAACRATGRASDDGALHSPRQARTDSAR